VGGSTKNIGLMLAREHPTMLVHARFTEKEREQLNLHADFAGSSLSSLIRTVMLQYMVGVEQTDEWRATNGSDL